ncbi:MAG TPA: 6-carboxytetrahydropterin synthase, partial [Bacteroidales bacterium]|nr:6-carboxytetrahydropterin synthase [Bacteroidales bacterium]
MSLIRISKEFHFEMAHVLDGYDGLCAYVHGHSYTLIITILGTPNN